jgi:hypothetical protein
MRNIDRGVESQKLKVEREDKEFKTEVTESAEDTEKKGKSTGLKTGHYKRKSGQGCRRYQRKRARIAYD